MGAHAPVRPVQLPWEVVSGGEFCASLQTMVSVCECAVECDDPSHFLTGTSLVGGNSLKCNFFTTISSIMYCQMDTGDKPGIVPCA